ncbi:hypothetical protein CJ179_43780 [Rhodococcus sp. ACS1]|jgi:hypothetical protein|uniref:Uncharacterized protein n=1 Tax=Rhodococcus koreensis TaxID=99653 RepID=A0A1H4V2S6_9NOCA|nr:MULTISPECIES: hypothetical protein [Rhodococcus]PBC36879.1 hypothetical protein CJ179_43780 [Rhodococcus sp. ACS1]QSE81419.1 hypothetical protein JWS14_20825 [Rhodococcus koreensis]SEC75225.1 hypothetical protein SAMN04490239_5313 [Rhodococcus koreensis]
MTTQESPKVSHVQVLADDSGSILAAVMRTAGADSIPDSGEDVAPQVSLLASEGQVLHEVSVSGASGEEMFESLDQCVIRVDAGVPTLVRRADA